MINISTIRKAINVVRLWKALYVVRIWKTITIFRMDNAMNVARLLSFFYSIGADKLEQDFQVGVYLASLPFSGHNI